MYNLQKYFKSPPAESSSLKASGSTDAIKSEQEKPLIKIEPEHYGLKTKNTVDLVTRCRYCHLKFKHATYLLYHITHLHKQKPENAVQGLMQENSQIQKCPKCMQNILSPILLGKPFLDTFVLSGLRLRFDLLQLCTMIVIC